MPSQDHPRKLDKCLLRIHSGATNRWLFKRHLAYSNSGTLIALCHRCHFISTVEWAHALNVETIRPGRKRDGLDAEHSQCERVVIIVQHNLEVSGGDHYLLVATGPTGPGGIYLVIDTYTKTADTPIPIRAQPCGRAHPYRKPYWQAQSYRTQYR